MSATQGALFPQGTRLWGDEAEAKRAGCLAAGLTPYLFGYWSSSTSEDLAVALAEYEAKMPDELADVIADLKAELLYRGAS